jgi:16S rRNA C967 or C1407 C5-methylase (RsmB/RsmF family)
MEAFLAVHSDFAQEDVGPAWSAALPEPPMTDPAGPGIILSPRRSATDGFFVALLRRS